MSERSSRQVQTEMRKTCQKRKLPASHVLKRGQRQKRGRARGRSSREADRTSEALPSASPREHEADPDYAREEPSRAPNFSWANKTRPGKKKKQTRTRQREKKRTVNKTDTVSSRSRPSPLSPLTLRSWQRPSSQ